MELTRNDIAMMRDLNNNIKTLLKVTAQEKEDKLLSYSEAEALLMHSRRWIQNKMREEVGAIKNVNDFLFKDVDYLRYGNQVKFKQASLERLRQSIIKQS